MPHSGFIKAIKLLGIAGAYWQGDVKQKQLTRIYGITFPKQGLLATFLAQREAARQRDHRKLGKELGYFAFSTEVGIGLPLWLPKGADVRERMIAYLRDTQSKRGYLPVITPHIGHKSLYITSGHYDKYKEGTFQEIKTPHEGEAFLLKPMNCPHHCLIYKAMRPTYRELPLRLAEFGTVYRYEQHGELHGLTRVRSFTQDDAHIFCRPDQVKALFMEVIDLVVEVFHKFGFTAYEAQISLRDSAKKERYIGHDQDWEMAEKAIEEAVKRKGIAATRVLGEAAFYGPKLDFMVKDALDRSWQLGTVQIDYHLPKRFGLTYIGPSGESHVPVMIHRAPFGSLERFMAILLEHTAGKLPLWLAPEQVIVLPISEVYKEYASSVATTLRSHGFRVSIDERDEKVSRKIRDAETTKVPYMLLVGAREAADHSVSVRKQGSGEVGSMKMDELIQQLKEEIE